MADITISEDELRELRRLAALAEGQTVKAAIPVTLVPDGWEAAARAIAREEIASLAGLVLRRLSEEGEPGRTRAELRRIFGEALADFSGHTKDEQPGA